MATITVDPLQTDSGLSTFDKLANLWLQSQAIKGQVDIETANAPTKVNDRVAVQTGAVASPGAVASKINWTYVGIGSAALLGVALLLKFAR